MSAESIKNTISKLRSYAGIDEDDIDMECRRVPVDFMRVAAAFAAAQRVSAEVKVRKDRVLAELDIETRQMLQASGSKVTEAMVRAQIAGNRRYTEIVMEEIDADSDTVLLKNGLVSLSIKKDMLVTLAANRRNELNE